jgi:hypothetical protein
MNIPSFDLTHIANEDGTVHPKAKIFFDQLISLLQKNLSPEGYKMPPQDAANIAILNNTDSKTAIVYNTTTNKLMVNENGVFKTVTTS